VNAHQQKEHDKKATLAEGYYTQISDLMATDPNTPEGKKSHEQAQHYMDDPKIRKMLYEGLNWKPLEEEPPPEAVGVQAGIQKQKAKEQKKQPWMPQGRAVMPPPSQQSQLATQLGQQKIATSQAEASKFGAESDKATAEAEAAGVKAEADRVTAEANRVTAEANVNKAKADAENLRAQADLYTQQAKDNADISPSNVREADALARANDSLAGFRDAEAKWLGRGKDMPNTVLQTHIKSARADMIVALKDLITGNQNAKKAVEKDTGWIYGPKSALVKEQDDTSKKSQDMKRAIAWFDGEATDAVTSGKMTFSDAVKQAYKMAGIEAPTPSMGPTDTGDTPARPQGVPGNATWNPDSRTWSAEDSSSAVSPQ
jgi:hypothetical protein